VVEFTTGSSGKVPGKTCEKRINNNNNILTEKRRRRRYKCENLNMEIKINWFLER
jgi:hypothetical protein